MGRVPKWLIKTLVGLVFAIIFFIAGSLYEGFKFRFQEPVEVKIINSSGQDIKSLSLSYSGYLMSGRINIKPPIKDKSTIVKYYQSGEGVFTIEAILGNGQHIKSNEGYVETGYSFNEIISSEGIISHISTISY